MSSWINLGALWRIVVFGILLGAGLPALFAVGLRALALGGTPETATEAGTEGAAGDTAVVGGSAGAVTGGLTGRIIAGICFAIVLAAIAWGIYSIVHHS